MTPRSISIVGAGYVGLCAAVGFSTKGYKVIASNHDPEKVASINKGIPPFYEPNLRESLQKAVKDGNIRCVLDCEEAILNTDITFIAVGTPSKPDGSIDLKYIEGSAREIGQALKKKRHVSSGRGEEHRRAGHHRKHRQTDHRKTLWQTMRS